MVANLSMGKDGKAEMMYVGEKPWHSMGTKLDNPATAEEAIVAAHLDWKVEKRVLRYPIKKEDGTLVCEGIATDGYATVREDTQECLGIVGNRYTVLQNKEAFSFFDAIVGEKCACYHTAGALGNGERIWLLAKLPGQIRVVGDDVVDKFMLLSNSHDGTSTVNVMMTGIRVVCQNTLNAAISSAKNIQRLRHTASMGMRVDEVRQNLGIIAGYFAQFEELSKRMTNIQLTQKMFNNYLTEIGIVTPDEDKKLSTRAENILNDVTQLFEHGKGNDMVGVKGTVWGAYNAVAEYADYVRVSRTEGNRSKSLLYGSGASLKQRAWDGAVSLL